MRSTRHSLPMVLPVCVPWKPGPLLLGLLAIWITACTPPFMDRKNTEEPVRTEPVQPKVETPKPAPGQATEKTPEKTAGKAVEEPKPEPVTRVLSIDSAASEARIHVYRTGRLEHLGHNHLIISKDLRGTINLEADIGKSTMQIEIPVDSFIVDDPEQRKTEGKGFEKELSEDEILNTTRSMHSDKVLNAARFPTVTISGKVSGGTPPGLTLDVAITLLGIQKTMQLPVTVIQEGDRIRASGEFSISQSDFGIEPFSMLMGSVSVKDEVKIHYHIVAR